MAGEFREVFKQNAWTDNPIFVQMLGICSTLAVTNNLSNTLVMTLGVMFVTGFSSFTVSALKELIPMKVRMMVQTLVIAFYVIIVDIILKAYLPEISKSLGPYVGLIITNCIIMGRAEAFAQANTPVISLWDGIIAGFGYMWILMVIAAIREILGSGSVFGVTILGPGSVFGESIGGDWFTPWTIMVTPASAFFLLGFLIWILKNIMNKQAGGK